MSSILMKREDFYNLPDDKRQRYATIELLCRNRMQAYLESLGRQDDDDVVKREYSAIVIGAARVAEINLSFPNYGNSFYEDFNNFYIEAVSFTSEILIGAEYSSKDSVALSTKSKYFIEIEIASLRKAIEESGLDQSIKSRLLDILEDLRGELHKNRFDIKKSMLLISYIGMGIVHATTFSAVFPTAYANIIEYVGKDKELEEKELQRLGRPLDPLLIADNSETFGAHDEPSTKRTSSRQEDDEIPF